ncbi:putative rRNA methyltransferase 3, mitochondrial [Hypsibius exemplaris]|uniref:rRNA methyltransferase 3, mitochondrial n=1 Tax=Hypsibius exemplaris TaxID=2072580 RepID=A0A1W0X4I9_HYPEX|nr:putative rRNA methyltransferase 3, mitochondrial [Hypsibius exemplaris]
MISLVRPVRLHSLYRSFHTASILCSRRGNRTRTGHPYAAYDDSRQNFEESSYQPVEMPVLERLKAMAASKPQTFNTNEFAKAVRGEMRPEVEQRVFKDAKPQWIEEAEEPAVKPAKLQKNQRWRTEDTAAELEVDAFGLEVEKVPVNENAAKRPPERLKKSLPRVLEQMDAEESYQQQLLDKVYPKKAAARTAKAAKKEKEKERKPVGSSKYPFLEDKDPLFKTLLTDVKNRAERAKTRRILLEGHRLICEALYNGVGIKTVFYSHPDLVEELPQQELRLNKTDVYQVTPKQMALWSDMTTPPGIMAIAAMPDPVVMDLTKEMPLTVVLDNIRDPGNMGAIIRVLAAAASSEIICIKGCVDPWDPKVLRSAMGAHFHIPIQYNMTWDTISNHLPNPASVYIADNLEERAPGPHLDRGETRGARLFPRPYKHRMPIIPYHHVDLKQGAVVLIIGGETAGVSQAAYLAAEERRGRKLVIPMGNYVESLNAASVVAVLAFEMRRQRLLLDDDFTRSEERPTEQVQFDGANVATAEARTDGESVGTEEDDGQENEEEEYSPKDNRIGQML